MKPKDPLTDNEIQVLRLLCKQMTIKEIATKMGVSDRSIDHSRDSMLVKTASRNKVGLIIFAIKNGIFKI